MNSLIHKALASAAACALALCAFGSASPSLASDEYPSLKVTLTNKTDARIAVAIASVSEGGENDGDFVCGWWNIEPGDSRTVSAGGYYSVVSGYYFYATSMGGKRIWTEKEGETYNAFWIHPSKAFRGRPFEPIKDGKHVIFRPFSPDRDGQIDITFVMK